MILKKSFDVTGNFVLKININKTIFNDKYYFNGICIYFN